MALLRTRSSVSSIEAATSGDNSSRTSHTLRNTGIKIAGVISLVAILSGAVYALDGTATDKTPARDDSLTSTTADSSNNNVPTSPAPADQPADDDRATNSSADDSTNTSMTVTVDGQNVPVPANGSMQQTVTNSNGDTTTVDLHASNTGTVSNHSSSYTSVHTYSSSQVSGDNHTTINQRSTAP